MEPLNAFRQAAYVAWTGAFEASCPIDHSLRTTVASPIRRHSHSIPHQCMAYPEVGPGTTATWVGCTAVRINPH
jgi:hypothetical protein